MAKEKKQEPQKLNLFDKEYSMDDYQGLLSGTNVIIDVKNIVKEPTWRL